MGSTWLAGVSKPWKEVARDSIQRTTGSSRGTVVDEEVRMLLSMEEPLEEMMAECLKWSFLLKR